MITTSPDGQWAAVRRGREVSLRAGAAPPTTSRIELPTDDADLLFVGPPSALAVVTRGPAADGDEQVNRLVLYQPPYLDAVARLDLDAPMRIAAVTGPRIVLISLDSKAITIVRIVGRGISSQEIDAGPVEFAVGLERNQVLLGLLRKLEAWDAVSGRPLLRMQLPLPPPPRIVGPAHGHVWATRTGSDEIVVCRMSDGRPFHHRIGEPLDDVICHPSSPLLILTTARGLVRLHCFAHSLTVIDAPWQRGAPLAQLVVGDDISLLGLAEGDDEPWRVPIGGAGAPAIVLEPGEALSDAPATAADKLRAVRERTAPASPIVLDIHGTDAGPAFARPPPPGLLARPPVRDPVHEIDRGEPAVVATPGGPRGPVPAITLLRSVDPALARTWRAPLAAFAADVMRGAEAEIPVVAAGTELGQLAHRLALPAAARRALVVLYSLYLVGEPGPSIARLAELLGDWTEPLGQGELHALAMLRRRGGRIRLRSAVNDLLDGISPRAIRLVGGSAASAPRPGARRHARAGSDAEIEAALASQLGRIAVIEGNVALAVLEASLHATAALALEAPLTRPMPWPRDASLIVVADPAAPGWVCALPEL